MKNNTLVALTVCIGAVSILAPTAARASDKSEIEALESRFAAAVSNKDLDGIMKGYAAGQGLFVFDLVPPRQYVGSDAYRKDWQGFIGSFKGPIKFTVSDLSISSDGTIAYSHSIQHISGTDTKGKPSDMTVRVSDVYRKAGGKWSIVQEHVSVPVDLETGKPDLNSTP